MDYHFLEILFLSIPVVRVTKVAHVLHFSLGVTKVGGIPLVVLIHKFTTKDDYASAFKFLRKSLGNFAFYGQMEPSIFMTDDSKSERQALNEIFPNSTLFLCTFHVLQAL